MSSAGNGEFTCFLNDSFDVPCVMGTPEAVWQAGGVSRILGLEDLPLL